MTGLTQYDQHVISNEYFSFSASLLHDKTCESSSIQEYTTSYPLIIKEEKNFCLPLNLIPAYRCSYLREEYNDKNNQGPLCTHAILKGLGVGNENINAYSAKITWIFKEGSGHLGRIWFSW
uniref:Protein root UVB sensitive/RUS domain-containing protein n=1 Tax=Glossina austeni TaxID=7395 RepID=A0A1A9V1G2_GLOAU